MTFFVAGRIVWCGFHLLYVHDMMLLCVEFWPSDERDDTADEKHRKIKCNSTAVTWKSVGNLKLPDKCKLIVGKDLEVRHVFWGFKWNYFALYQLSTPK